MMRTKLALYDFLRSSPHAIALVLLTALVMTMLYPSTARANAAIVDQYPLSHTSDYSEGPDISLGAGRLVAVWGERSAKELVLSSSWLGAGWTGATPFGGGGVTAAQWPSVTVDGSGTAHIAYASGDRLFYRAQRASGEWSDPVQVATGALPYPIRIARASNGTLWVVWRDSSGTVLSYRYSHDGGQSWQNGSDNGVIATDAGTMAYESIAVDQAGNLHVVWYIVRGDGGGDIRFADWNGSSFNIGNVTTDGRANYDAEPALTIDPQNVQHLVWRKQDNGQNRWLITYARRAPGGGWGDYQTIAATNGDAQYAPAVGTDALGNVYATYSDPTGPKTRRIVLMYRLGGGAWSGIAVSSPESWDSRSAVVGSVANGSIEAHVVYQHEGSSSNGDVIYTRIRLADVPAQAPAPPSAPAPAPPPQAPAPPSAVSIRQPVGPKADCAYAASTQHNICAGFRRYWERFGGVALLGNPITEELVENGVTVQYFERARLEYHASAQPARFDVLLGWLGSELTFNRRVAGEAPFQDTPPGNSASCTYVAATKHNLCAGFRSYWQRFGGLDAYGNPISEEFVENGVTVQYFERARLEYHPGAAPTRYNVLLGLVGSELLAARGQ